PKTYRLNAGSITSKNDVSLVPINVIVYRGRISNQERHQKSARRRSTSVLHGASKPAYRSRARARRGPQGQGGPSHSSTGANRDRATVAGSLRRASPAPAP